MLNGWIGQYWGIQWCYGVMFSIISSSIPTDVVKVMGMLTAVSCILNALFLRETRGDVLLSRRALQLTRKTGTKHITAAELQKKSFLTLMQVSIIRPFRLLRLLLV